MYKKVSLVLKYIIFIFFQTKSVFALFILKMLFPIYISNLLGSFPHSIVFPYYFEFTQQPTIIVMKDVNQHIIVTLN